MLSKSSEIVASSRRRYRRRMLASISSQHHLLQNREVHRALAPVNAMLGETGSIGSSLCSGEGEFQTLGFADVILGGGILANGHP